MLKKLSIFAAMIFVCLFAAGCGKAQTTNDTAAKIYGDWAGESSCVDKEKFPACKDEKVVYHFSKSKTDASKIHLAADKIVNGANELMYELDFTFDAAKNVISGEFTANNNHGIWEYKIDGDTMEGTLRMFPEKALGREIKVKKKS
jgi:stress response protein SCP2